MKRLEAYIKPFTVEALRQALAESGFGVQRLLQVEEFSQDPYQEVVSGTEYSIETRPRLLMIMYIEDSRVDEVIRIIQTNASTDHSGDGRIFISTVDRIATVAGSE
ncbi:MAG: P-II family nitrogen regulator [Leptospiraceae bacterium]|nr:P-II family nitrogen regulator [Leptospiraceae bacterium]